MRRLASTCSPGSTQVCFACRSADAFGLETHLTTLAQLIQEFAPSVAVLDGIASLTHGPSGVEVTPMMARQIDLLKTREITAMSTTLGARDERTTVGISSLVDTWLLLRNVELDGERNRLLYVLKSRGIAHSNQVREFMLTGRGAELVDVYVGPAARDYALQERSSTRCTTQDATKDGLRRHWKRASSPPAASCRSVG